MVEGNKTQNSQNCKMKHFKFSEHCESDCFSVFQGFELKEQLQKCKEHL